MTDISFLAWSSFAGLFFVRSLQKSTGLLRPDALLGTAFSLLAVLDRQTGLALPLAFRTGVRVSEHTQRFPENLRLLHRWRLAPRPCSDFAPGVRPMGCSRRVRPTGCKPCCRAFPICPLLCKTASAAFSASPPISGYFHCRCCCLLCLPCAGENRKARAHQPVLLHAVRTARGPAAPQTQAAHAHATQRVQFLRHRSGHFAGRLFHQQRQHLPDSTSVLGASHGIQLRRRGPASDGHGPGFQKGIPHNPPIPACSCFCFWRFSCKQRPFGPSTFSTATFWPLCPLPWPSQPAPLPASDASSPEKSGLLLALAVLAPLALYAVACTRDYLTWNDRRWTALHSLTAEHHIPPEHIDGGFEFNGLNLFDPAYEPKQGKSSWWVVDDRYVVAFGPISGIYGNQALPVATLVSPLRPADCRTPKKQFLILQIHFFFINQFLLLPGAQSF